MSNDPWASASFDGNRRLQQKEFMALSFREKLEMIERMAEVSARLAAPAPSEPGGPGKPRDPRV